MTSREVGSAAVIRGSTGPPHRPAPRPAGPHYPPGRTVRLRNYDSRTGASYLGPRPSRKKIDPAV